MEQIAKCRGIPSWAAAGHDVSSPSSPSWEEQAFARDAAANLLVWPPRSYSCTFCRREFRSAQALGGHMNVHRRDRARLRHHHQDDEVQEEPHVDDSFTYKQPAPVSNPSTTTTPSYRSTTIKEEESKRHKVIICMPARGQEAIHQRDQDLDDESGRRCKRSRVDQPPPVSLPIFVRSMAAAVATAPHEGFALDYSEVLNKTIASPTNSSPDPPLVDRPEVDQFIKKQQLVDLELRLGTNPKLHDMQPS